MTPVRILSAYPNIEVEGMRLLLRLPNTKDGLRIAAMQLDMAYKTLRRPIQDRLADGRLRVACRAAGADLRRVSLPSGIPEKHFKQLSSEAFAETIKSLPYEEYPARPYHPQVKAIDSPPSKGGHGFRHSRQRLGGVNRRAKDGRGARVADGV